MFWSVFGVLVLAPLVAVWRNIEALSLVVAESITQGRSRHRNLQPLIQRVLQAVATILLVIWLLALGSTLSMFTKMRYVDYDWAASVACAEQRGSCIVPINPMGWSFRLRSD